MFGQCERCGVTPMIGVFLSETGYFVGQVCGCIDKAPQRLSRASWQTFNGAEEALLADEYERV